MKKTVFIITLLIAVLLCGCSENQPEESQSSKSDTLQTESSTVSGEEKSGIRIGSSSVSMPLSLGEWGECAKYNTEERKYVNVPVRITLVQRGDNVKKTVREFMNKTEGYTYSEPQKNYEWVLVDYEISLDDFPIYEGGADSSLASFVVGKEGGSVEQSGKAIGVSTVNITDEKYYFEGIVKGQIAFKLPKGFKDYLLLLGEYEEIQAVFSE